MHPLQSSSIAFLSFFLLPLRLIHHMLTSCTINPLTFRKLFLWKKIFRHHHLSSFTFYLTLNILVSSFPSRLTIVHPIPSSLLSLLYTIKFPMDFPLHTRYFIAQSHITIPQPPSIASFRSPVTFPIHPSSHLFPPLFCSNIYFIYIF